MSKRYLITLTPTGKFFFGGEMTFQVNGEDTDFTSYIITSNRFPQQTSLLGMLRFLILRNADESVFCNDHIQDKSEAERLIGNHSFSVNPDNKETSFGMIERISGCFLMKGDKAIDVESLAKRRNINKVDNTTTALINGKSICLPKDDNYNPKDEYKSQWNKYFIEDMRMGINKDYQGRTSKDEDKALYKQECLRFKDKDLKFAFNAEIDDSIDLMKYDGQLISLGGDSSMFVIGIQSVPKSAPKPEADDLQVILTSPAYLDRKDLAPVAYAVTETIPFRFMKTTVETKSYNRLHKQIGSSKKYSLYAQGSTFFFADENKKTEFIKNLEKYHDFRQIGYNEYK